jgi:hypothetical protein
MKCGGIYDTCGDRCPECVRFEDDCDGHPGFYMNDNSVWTRDESVDVINEETRQAVELKNGDIWVPPLTVSQAHAEHIVESNPSITNMKELDKLATATSE